MSNYRKTDMIDAGEICISGTVLARTIGTIKGVKAKLARHAETRNILWWPIDGSEPFTIVNTEWRSIGEPMGDWKECI